MKKWVFPNPSRINLGWSLDHQGMKKHQFGSIGSFRNHEKHHKNWKSDKLKNWSRKWQDTIARSYSRSFSPFYGGSNKKNIIKIRPLDAKNGLKQNCFSDVFLCFGVFWYSLVFWCVGVCWYLMFWRVLVCFGLFWRVDVYVLVCWCLSVLVLFCLFLVTYLLLIGVLFLLACMHVVLLLFVLVFVCVCSCVSLKSAH